MHLKAHMRNSLFRTGWNPASVTLTILLALLFLIFLFLLLSLTAPSVGSGRLGAGANLGLMAVCFAQHLLT